MSFTTRGQITGDPVRRTIEDGKARFYKGHTFFYAEDIMAVLEQRKESEGIAQLQLVDLVFARIDGGENHDIHNVVGLALEEVDEAGNHIDWYEKIALAWPPYYEPRSVPLENDDASSPHFGREFGGSQKYPVGFAISKDPSES